MRYVVRTVAKTRTRKSAPAPVEKLQEGDVPRIPGDVVPESRYLGLSPIGTSGLKESGGWIYEEFLPQLAGRKGQRLYKEMADNSASIGAIRRLVRDLVRQVEWTVEPNERSKDKTQAKREAEFIEGCMHDMEHSFNSLVSEALTMLEQGFAPCLLTYKLRRGQNQPPEFNSKYKDGRFGWRSIELRAQETLDRWEFDPDTRRLLGMWQQDSYAPRASNVFMPIERLVNFRTESTKNNPEGRSLFRNAVVPYMRLKHIETIEMIGIERELTGMPVMEVPLRLLAKEKDAEARAVLAYIERGLASIKQHERMYMIVPASETPDGNKTGYKFSLLQSPGTGRIDVSKSKLDYKTDIFQSCLAQFIMLGQNGNGGARALSSDQTDLFSLIMFSILESIREAFQREAIDRMCMLNRVDADDIPQLKFGDVETPNLAALGQYINNLNQAGIFVPNDDLQRHLYKIAGLPWEPPVQVVGSDELIMRALGGGDSLEDIAGGGGGEGGEETVELLNGAQLASLVQVVEAMASGTLPMESTSTILTSSLGIDEGTVARILEPVNEKLMMQGPMVPGAMTGQPGMGGPPGAPQPGAPQGGAPGQPDLMQQGDPAKSHSVHPDNVVSADDLINSVMKHLVRKGMAHPRMVARLLLARADRALDRTVS